MHPIAPGVRSSVPFHSTTTLRILRRSLCEEVYAHQHHTFEEALACLQAFLEDVSHAKHLHSSLDDVPPDEFEANFPTCSRLSGLDFLGALHSIDTGGEVKKLILCRWLHRLLKGRSARLSRRFFSQPTHQVNNIDGRGNDYMAEMRFAQANVARPPQTHGARPLRVRSFNPGPMTIALASTHRYARVGVQQAALAASPEAVMSRCAAFARCRRSDRNRLYNRVEKT